MKKNLLLLLVTLFSLTLAYAQPSTKALTLKNEKPRAGQEVRFTYNPVGTPLEKAASVFALVYGYDGKKAKVQEVALTKSKAGWQGKFTPAPEADGIIMTFREDETFDLNSGKGYSFYFYDAQKQPVPGARYGLASAYAEWGAIIGLDRDAPKALELIAREAAMYPDQKRHMVQTKVYALGVAFKGEESKQKIVAELEDLAKQPSLTTKDLAILANSYTRLELKEKAEPYAQQIRAKEPAGEFVQEERMMEYYNTEDPAKRKELALAFAAAFPKYEHLSNVLSGVAMEYAAAGNWQEFEALLAKYPVVSSSDLFNNIAWQMYEKDEDIAKARELAQKAYHLAQKELTQPAVPKDDLYTDAFWKNYLESGLGQVADTYGAILLKAGDAAGAEKYLAEGYRYTHGKAVGVNERYAEVLAKSADKAKALKTLEGMVSSGNSSAKIKGYLKDLYAHTHNGDTGFDAYFAKVEAPAIEKLRSDLKKKMILERAPSFELRDLNGNVVSLASLKGKTVIVDFWATWCGPCIASFPGMQQAVNKFKDNNKVAFVFVNSWENGDDKKKTASDFLAKKNYSFQVLMDEENKMIDAYKVNGIPTKFVLDANGNIRFKSGGYSGSSDKTVQEITMMIDLLRPELLSSAK